MGFIPVRKAFKAQDDSPLTIKVLKLQLKIFSVAVAADLLFPLSPNSSNQSFNLTKD